MKNDTGNKNGLTRPSNRIDEIDNVQFCDYIRKKIMKMFKTGKKIRMKVLSRLFKILNEKEELYAIFK